MYKLNLNNNQRGSILVYAVLMLASILAIALSLAGIFLPKIRSITNAGANSIAAIYAADSATEWCLYTSRGGTPSLSAPTMTNGATYTISPASCAVATLDHQIVGTYRNVSRSFQVVMNSTSGSGTPDFSWQNTVGVAVSGNSLTDTGASGWGNSGASSVATLTSGDGYVEFSTNETNTYKMLGLGNGDSNQSYTDIDFGLQPAANGLIEIYEGGVARGFNFGTYVPGDIFRIAVESGTVKYYKNGSLLYTSSATPTYPLLVDTGLATPGATLTNITFSN